MSWQIRTIQVTTVCNCILSLSLCKLIWISSMDTYMHVTFYHANINTQHIKFCVKLLEWSKNWIWCMEVISWTFSGQIHFMTFECIVYVRCYDVHVCTVCFCKFCYTTTFDNCCAGQLISRSAHTLQCSWSKYLTHTIISFMNLPDTHLHTRLHVWKHKP